MQAMLAPSLPVAAVLLLAPRGAGALSCPQPPSRGVRCHHASRAAAATPTAPLPLPQLSSSLSSVGSPGRPLAAVAKADDLAVEEEQQPASGPAPGPASASAPASSARPSQQASSFDAFDYAAHWYPVAWARDVPLNQPVKVTLFDVDYAIARTVRTTEKAGKDDGGVDGEDAEEVMAMVDECPHKKASLSEGRVTGCGTNFQCSYHGWSFDGRTGDCVQIPQTVISRSAREGGSSDGTTGSRPSKGRRRRRREDGTAVAARISQGMVWLHPFRTPLEAMAAEAEGALPPPPRVPELDLPGFKMCPVVRDFPIDWSVLLENIMDPDHGLFAHGGMSGKSFDLYSADGLTHSQSLVEEEINGGKGWTVTSRVDAVPKLTQYDKELRMGMDGADNDSEAKVSSDAPLDKIYVKKKKKRDKDKDDEQPKVATTTFVAPSLVYMGRRDADTDETSFVNAFWVCPVGTGRSRFMSASVAKIALPRWLTHLNLNNFLDQDTYLLAGQQRAVLAAEAEAAEKAEATTRTAPSSSINTAVRKRTYVYRSPTERLGSRLGQFFDATLSRVPNRVSTLRRAVGSSAAARLGPIPSRRTVLDRYEQHTRICADSMDVVRNCNVIDRASRVVALAALLVQGWSRAVGVGAGGPYGAASVAAGRVILRPAALAAILVTAAASNWLARKVRKQFYFKFDEDYHRKDIETIPDIWLDPTKDALLGKEPAR